MFKRSMSLILAIVMIIGMLPLSVFAEEGAVCSCTAPCAAEACNAECPVCAADAAACAAEGGEEAQEPSEEAPESEEPSQEAPAEEPAEEAPQAAAEEPVQPQAEEPKPSIPAGHVSSVLFEGSMAADWMPSVNSGELEYAGQLWLYISSVTDESGNPVAYRTNYNNPSDPANNVVLEHAAGEGYAVQVDAEAGSSHSWGVTEAGFASIIVTCKLVYIHEDMSHLPAKGTLENPKAITDLAYTSVSLTEETASGYYYSYTSTLNGYVAYSAGEVFGLTLTNQTTGATDSLWKTNREGKTIQSGPCYVKVSTGDVVLIKVSSRSGNAVSGSIFGSNVYGSSTEGQGIALNGDNYIATLAAGETINFTCRFQGRKVYVYGEGITVSNGGTTYTATAEGVSFTCVATGDYSDITLTNTGSATATAEILAVYDYGTKQNPEIVTVGSHTLTSEDSNAGWEYLFNATESGVVKFTVHSATNGWQYNLEASVDRFSDDASPLATQYMSVTAGESMTIFMGTWSGDAAYRPAGEISWSIEYVDGMGTQENPAPYEGSMQYATITTGKIPAGGLVWFQLPATSAGRGLTISDSTAYAIQGEMRYDYSEYFGCVTVDRLLPNANGDYIVGIGNDGASAKSFQLFAGDALGTIDNPASFDLSESNGFTRTITVELTDGAPIYYQMSTEAEGTLTVTIDSATSGWQMQLALPYDGVSGILASSANGDEPTTSLTVPAWNAVRLMLATEGGEAGTITFTATYGDGTTTPDVPENPEGTQENPIQNYGEFPIVTPEIAAGETLYYAVYRAEGTVLTWEDADASLKVNGLNFASGSLLTAGPNGYTELAVTNKASVAKSFTLDVAFALGHPENPDQLQLGENTATLAADNWEGYNYTWTAPADGTLITTMVDGLWVYTINNLTTGIYGEMSYNDTHEAVCETAVSEGDLIQVVIGSFDPADYSSPAANIVFTAEFRGVAGTYSNPITWTSEPPIVTAQIPAGESLYYSIRGVDGQFLTCEDADALITVDGAVYDGSPIGGTPRNPVTIGITNNAAVAKSFTVAFSFPEGHMENPAELLLGENTITLEEGSEGYYYGFTAEKAGNLTIAMTCDTWQYTMNNLTSGAYGSTHLSDDAEPVASETITVSAGDQVVLMVNTYTPGEWTAPAGEVTFTAEFDALGSYTNPIVWVQELPIVTDVIPAGETVYYSGARANGMVMSCADADAVLTLNQQAYDGEPIVSDFFAPAVIGITNSGEEAKAFTIEMHYPVGHPENPAELVLGENIAHVPADSWDGYNFTWTAADDGTLVTTMAEGLWVYTVNNLTTGIYGNQCYNDTDEPVCETAVSKGDLIQVIIGTFDPADYSSPAADIVFTAEFLGVPGSYSNPIAWAGEPPMVTAEIAPGATVYYSLTKAGGMTMSCQDPDAVLTLNGSAYNGQLLECDSWNPAIVGITNSGDKAKSFSVDLTFPLGHPENPAKLVLGENVAHVPADSWDGYNFTWTATANGQLTLAMTGDLWVYTVNNLTTGEYGNMCYNDTDEPVCHVNVSKGDQIQVSIGTFNPEDYSAPAADILFTASFVKVSSISAKLAATTLTYGQPSSKGLQVGDSVQINVFGADKKVPLSNVSYEITSGGDYADLTDDGIVTATVAGKTVKVKATWTAGKTTKTATISIKTKAMLPGALTIDAGAAWGHENGYLIADGVNEEGVLMVLASDAAKTFQLAVSSANYIGEPLEEAASVTWSTSSSKLATVSKTGLVTVKKGVSGIVTITAKSKLNSAVKATLTIEIVDYTPDVLKSSVTVNSYLEAPVAVDYKGYAADPLKTVEFAATKGDMTGITVELEEGKVVIKTDAILKNGTRSGKITLTTEHGHTKTESFSVKISNKAPTVTIKTTRKLNTKDDASYAEITVTAKLGKVVMDITDITLDSLSFDKAATDAAGLFKLTPNNGDAKLDKSGKVTVQVTGCRQLVTKSVTVGTESVANKAVLSQKTVTLSKSNPELAEALVNVDAYFVGQTVTVASCTTTSAQGKKLVVEINGDEIKISLAEGSDIKTGTYSFTVKTLDQDGNPLKNVTLKVKVTK